MKVNGVIKWIALNYTANSSGHFLRIFPCGGGGIFWKGTFLWDNILEGDRHGWRPNVWPTYHAWIRGSGAYSRQNFWNLKHGNAISYILSIQICSKIYAKAKYICIWNQKEGKNAQKVKKILTVIYHYLLEGDSNGRRAHVWEHTTQKIFKFATRKCNFLHSEHLNLL